MFTRRARNVDMPTLIVTVDIALGAERQWAALQDFPGATGLRRATY